MWKFRWVWLSALLVLGGCNTVYSEKPLFTAEDAAGAPPLKPGLWMTYQLEGDEPCRFDFNRPVRKWPDCVSWVLVREGDVLQFGDNGKERVWISHAYILAAGQPRILQTTWLSSGADHEGSGTNSQFSAVVPIGHDESGRISDYRTWEAQCGPPNATQYPPDSGPHPTTLAPLPGLVMNEDGNSCEAKDREAVRRSVAATEAWDTNRNAAHWVRESRPDDFARGRLRKLR